MIETIFNFIKPFLIAYGIYTGIAVLLSLVVAVLIIIFAVIAIIGTFFRR